MRHGEPPLNRLDELHLQRELKEVLIENVRAIYGPQNPSNFGFDIITHRSCHGKHNTNFRKSDFIVVRAIVYTAPNCGKWKMLKESTSDCRSATSAFQEFWKELEYEMAKWCGFMKVGDIYEGEKKHQYVSGYLEEKLDRAEESEKRMVQGRKRSIDAIRRDDEREQESDLLARERSGYPEKRLRSMDGDRHN